MPSQGYLWLLSFLGALLLCMIACVSFGFYSLKSWIVKERIPPKPPEATVIIISPKSAATPLVVAPAPAPPKDKPSFARTSEDQSSPPPKIKENIGERDTTATSDAPVVATAPEQISQQGRPPRREEEIETTVSRLQDGALEHNALAAPMTPPTPPQPQVKPSITPEKTTETTEPGKDQETVDANSIKPTPMSKGNTIVERAKDQESTKPKTSDALKATQAAAKENPVTPPATLPKPSTKEPGFRGNQQRTLLSGSISRKGNAALNVSKTSLGKYHSAISRAIEAEWHRNCTTYRDLITPGTITVRFVIDSKGDVRSASVVDMVAAGQIQKGFTLNSIRQAKLPTIPADLQKELDGEPLEVLYNFYF
jgi:outer membrane biosynthesis protein TonB